MHLRGIRVVDLTRILSGPFCSLLLADMGAEVIKVEPPGGDPLRGQGVIVEGLSWYFAAFNRNKRSVLLNLRSVSGRAALRRLIATADVVVDNFRPGVMADLGLDWSQLSRLRPGIIHTSVTGFGEHGPYADRPSFDFIAQAMSGFMSCNGTPETGPMRAGAPISALVAGLYAALGTVAALYRRVQTGRGERVGVAMMDSLLSLGAFLNSNFFATGQPPVPTGNDHALVAPYGLFTARDGEIAIAPSNDGVYAKLLGALDLQALREHPDFRTNDLRVRHRAAINALINARIAQAPKAYWIERLNAAGVPCGMVMSLAEVFADPQVVSQEMVLAIPHPGHGTVKMTGFPLKFREAPSTVRYPAPELGAHTVSVLRALGYSDPELAELGAESHTRA
ncbi:MAG TPA: CoA transferase [Candidatus Tectomicrobia bacterium]|jgi:CoA:oxalate CoA-transferase|nr:CoA transferase [Candidatus Tectomicrobia bacterium]